MFIEKNEVAITMIAVVAIFVVLMILGPEEERINMTASSQNQAPSHYLDNFYKLD